MVDLWKRIHTYCRYKGSEVIKTTQFLGQVNVYKGKTVQKQSLETTQVEIERNINKWPIFYQDIVDIIFEHHQVLFISVLF